MRGCACAVRACVCWCIGVCVCVCVCGCARARACVRASERACRRANALSGHFITTSNEDSLVCASFNMFRLRFSIDFGQVTSAILGLAGVGDAFGCDILIYRHWCACASRGMQTTCPNRRHRTLMAEKLSGSHAHLRDNSLRMSNADDLSQLTTTEIIEPGPLRFAPRAHNVCEHKHYKHIVQSQSEIFGYLVAFDPEKPQLPESHSRKLLLLYRVLHVPQ